MKNTLLLVAAFLLLGSPVQAQVCVAVQPGSTFTVEAGKPFTAVWLMDTTVSWILNRIIDLFAG